MRGPRHGRRTAPHQLDYWTGSHVSQNQEGNRAESRRWESRARAAGRKRALADDASANAAIASLPLLCRCENMFITVIRASTRVRRVSTIWNWLRRIIMYKMML